MPTSKKRNADRHFERAIRALLVAAVCLVLIILVEAGHIAGLW
jgi:hypothetical protein